MEQRKGRHGHSAGARLRSPKAVSQELPGPILGHVPDEPAHLTSRTQELQFGMRRASNGGGAHPTVVASATLRCGWFRLERVQLT